MAREDNVLIFEDSMKLCRSKDKLREAIENSEKRQIFYAEGWNTAEDFSLPEAGYEKAANVIVSKKRSYEAASAYKGKRVAVHNFASATNPGGGVTKGSNAQEEALCRISTLYPLLSTQKIANEFYRPHRNMKDPLHNDDCIYTPDVVVFKTDNASPVLMPEKDWYSVDVITCAAPNLRENPSNSMNSGDGNKKATITDAELLKMHEKRLRAILDTAVVNGAEVVILGAFGCGAFQNPPFIVAQAVRNVLPDYFKHFDTIEFAIYSSRDDSNYRTFSQKLKFR